MVKDPAIETLDKLIDGFEAVGHALKDVWEMQKMQNKMLDELTARVEKLEMDQQIIKDDRGK